MPKQRDLVKEVIRVYACPEVATWDEAAEKVGLDPKRLAWWRRRSEWPELCREVGEEDLARALPIAARRLIDTARVDKSASGVTAAKALIDLCLDRDTNEGAVTEDGGSEETQLGDLTQKEREVICRGLAKLFRRAAG
jgi:hypothetical protein